MPRARLRFRNCLPQLVLGARAKFLLSTALMTVGLQGHVATRALADDVYLNNGDPGTYAQRSGRWRNNSPIWSTAVGQTQTRRLDPQNDTAVLPGRSSTQTQVRLEVENGVDVGIIRAESSHYTLAGRSGRLIGSYTERDSDGNVVQNRLLIFELAAAQGNATSPTELKILTSLEGNVVVRGEGLLTYSGESGSNMLSLTIGELVNFVSTGESRGELDNAGRFELADEGGVQGIHKGQLNNTGTAVIRGTLEGAVDNADDATLALRGGKITEDVANAENGLINGYGEIEGTLTNLGRVEVSQNPNGTRRKLTVGRLENQSGGVVVVEDRHRLESADIENDGGTIRIASGGALSMTGSDPLSNINGATLRLDANGTMNGNVANDSGATVDVRGTLTGNVTNAGNATLTVRQGGRIDGAISDNSSSVTTQIAGTVTGRVTNASTGSVLVAGSGAIGSLSNQGSFTLAQGGRVTGPIASNTGTLILNGSVGGITTNSSGGVLTLNSTGTLTTLNNSGTADLAGTTSGTVNNLGTGTTNLLAGSSISAVDNRGSGTVNVAENAVIRGDLIGNDGTTNLNGRLLGNATNDAGGALNIGQTGSVGGDVVNNGTLDLAGSVAGDVVNNSNATIGSDVAGAPATIAGSYTSQTGTQTELRGSTVVSGDFINNGSMIGQADQDSSLEVGQTFMNNGTITGTETSAIRITAENLAFGANNHITGRVFLNGAIANSGRIDYTDSDTAMLMGDLLNTPAGVVNVSATLTGNNFNINNYSNVNVEAAGSIVGLNQFNNQSGQLVIAAGASVAANSVVNGASGQINNAGVISAPISNTGHLINTGIIQGALTTNAPGTAALQGVVTGVITNGGTTWTTGDLTARGVVNTNAMTVTAGTDLQLGAGSLSNSGQFDLNGTMTAAVATNEESGTLRFGGGTLTGTLRNFGAVSGTGTVAGNLTNYFGSSIALGSGETLSVSGITANAGAIVVAGNYMGAIDNRGRGEVTLNGGTIGGTIDNLGRLSGNGIVTGVVNNLAGGVVQANGGQTLTLQQGAVNAGHIVLNGGRISGAIENNGEVSGTGTLSSAVNNLAAGTVRVAQGERLQFDGGLANAGRVEVLGNLAGAVSNNAGGMVVLGGGRLSGNLVNGGTLTGDGRLDNRLNNVAGSLTAVQASDRLILSQGVDNTGTIAIAGRLSGDVNNLAGGQLVMEGGRAENDVTNAGAVSGAGTISGRLNNIATGTVDIAAGQALNVVGGTVNQNTMQIAGALLGGLDNAASGVVTLNGGGIDGAIINRGSLSGSGTLVDGIENLGTASLAGEIGGTTTNRGAFATSGDLIVANLVNRGRATALVTAGTTLALRSTAENAGTMTVNGTLRAAGTQAPDVAGPILVANSGVINGNGRVEGVVENLVGGLFRMTGTVNGVLNAGQIELASDDALNVAYGISNTGRIANGGALTADIDNRGVIENQGQITGTISNHRAGTVLLAGAIEGRVNNSGHVQTLADARLATLDNRAGGTAEITTGTTLSLSNGVANAGAMVVRGTLEGGVENLSSGRIELDRGVIAGDLLSRGTLTGSGRVTGRLTNANEQQAMTVSGRLRAGVLDNRETLVVERSAQLRVDRGLENHDRLTLAGSLQGDLLNQASGQATLGSGARIDGSAINNGLIQANTARISGTLTNNGVVDMHNRNVGGELTLGGLNGTGQFQLDLNLAEMTSDKIRVIGGPASGDMYFDFDILSDATVNDLGASVTVVELDPSQKNDLSFSYEPISLSSARIVYELVRNRETGNLDVVSGTNPAIGALLGNVALTHSLIGSVINRPSSPYVVGMAYEDAEKSCGIGSWGRALGGTATAQGKTDNGIASYQSEVRAKYYGMQVGTDLACFNGYFDGWNMAFGALLGVNQGSTEQPNYANSSVNSIGRRLASVTKSDFDQIYGGLYMTASRDRWTVDLQYRHEVTDFDLNNDAFGQGDALRLTDATFQSRANTISGSLSYMMPIANSEWQFVPSAGFAWSKIKIDQIRFDDGYTLDFEDTERKVGFFGGTLTRTYVQPEQNAALNLFATGTYYKDFASSTDSTFTLAGDDKFSPQHLKTDNLGAYTELSIGANYVKVLSGQMGRARQFSAGTRIDARFGDSLDSVGVTGQLRLQF